MEQGEEIKITPEEIGFLCDERIIESNLGGLHVWNKTTETFFRILSLLEQGVFQLLAENCPFSWHSIY